MYEESLRMPFLISWPEKISARNIETALIQNIDFAPTLLEAAGLPVHVEMQGRSFLPMALGKKQADWRDAIYYQYYEDFGSHWVRPHFGIRTDRHKLIKYQWDKSSATELFDLYKDPNEEMSIYEGASQSTVLKKLTSRLHQLHEEFGSETKLNQYK
jgi:arylsulfatase A-like enzyme